MDRTSAFSLAAYDIQLIAPLQHTLIYSEHRAILLKFAVRMMVNLDPNACSCQLLLLPYFSSPTTLRALQDSFGPPIRQALLGASRFGRKSAPAILDVAVIYKDPSPDNEQNAAIDYDQFQNRLALMYKLMCIICTEDSIDIEYGNDVETRVLLIDDTRNYEDDSGGHSKGASPGPLVSLTALARCHRPWARIYAIATVDGEVLLHSFSQIRNHPPLQVLSHLEVTKLDLGSGSGATNQKAPSIVSLSPRKWPTFKKVAVGGTFDHLHAGHKLLLTVTALLLNAPDPRHASSDRSITIGITGDKLLQKKKFVDQMQDWDERQRVVESFLLGILELRIPTDSLKSTDRASSPDTGGKVVRQQFESGLAINYDEIFDPFGPTITDPAIAALVVSGETRSGGQAVNDKREAQGWPSLEILEVDVLNAEGKDEVASDSVSESYKGKISSTEIRRKLHDRRTVEK